MGTRERRWLGVGCVLMGCASDGFGSGEAVEQTREPVAAHELGGVCWRLSEPDATGVRYLDAYTSGDGNVVTRPHQSDDTQRWCFTQLLRGGPGGTGGSATAGAAGGPSTVYRIQHRSFAGQYLDAYESVNGKAVLRNMQGNDSQHWHIVGSNSAFRVRNMISSLYLKALTSSSDDFRVVMTSSIAEATIFTWGSP
jgi:hypothetical protein